MEAHTGRGHPGGSHSIACWSRTRSDRQRCRQRSGWYALLAIRVSFARKLTADAAAAVGLRSLPILSAPPCRTATTNNRARAADSGGAVGTNAATDTTAAVACIDGIARRIDGIARGKAVFAKGAAVDGTGFISVAALPVTSPVAAATAKRARRRARRFWRCLCRRGRRHSLGICVERLHRWRGCLPRRGCCSSRDTDHGGQHATGW